MMPSPGFIMTMNGEPLDEETLATAVRLCRQGGFQTMGHPFVPSPELILTIEAIRHERKRISDLLEKKRFPGICDQHLTDLGKMWNSVIDEISSQLRGKS